MKTVRILQAILAADVDAHRDSARDSCPASTSSSPTPAGSERSTTKISQRFWVLRHGAHQDIYWNPLWIRGLYDLVFAYEDADPRRPAFGAGLAVFLTGLVLFEYKGAIFWKMTAGMGDIVFAPLYQALRRRGVEFEFFHRLDGLHLDAQHQAIDAISMGRQVRLADGVDHYEPLTTVRGLPVFPAQPLSYQLSSPDRDRIRDWQSLETHWGREEDAESRVLRRGVDFDHVVLAVSLGMGRHRRQGARRRPAELAGYDHAGSHRRHPGVPDLAWPRRAIAGVGTGSRSVTTSAYLPPFETWASMGQDPVGRGEWPDDDRARNRRLLLWQPRRALADRRGPGDLRPPLRKSKCAPTPLDS